MEKMFCLGLVLGAVGGMLLVANNFKARSLVKKSQTEVMEKVNEMMEQRLQESQDESQTTGKKQKSK